MSDGLRGFGSLRTVLLTIGLFAPSLAATGGDDRPALHAQQQNGGSKSSPDKVVEQCRAVLKTTGPNNRRDRENAVTTLFSMDHPGAHRLLQEYVGPGIDPEKVRQLVLRELPRRLSNRNEKAFWASKYDAQIRRSYVLKLIAHFGDVSPKPTAKAPAQALAEQLRDLARDAIVQMAQMGMLKGFQDALDHQDAVVRRQAMRAMGVSRNPAWAQELAKYLDREDNDAKVAERAIYNLTYKSFTSAKEFAAWWQANQDVDYTTLAEKAARAASAEIARKTAAGQREKIDLVVEMVELLARSASKDRWKQIRGFVFQGQPEGLLESSFERLRTVLADATIDPKGVDAKDRLDFLAAISKRFETEPTEKARALLLEVASYLCGPGETEPRKVQEGRLRDALTKGSETMRTAALRGMRRFFSASNRALVVTVASRAFDGKRTKEVGEAIATLRSAAWRGPKADDPDKAAWLATLRRMLVDSKLDVAVRKDVILAMCRPDMADGHAPDVFQTLLLETQRETLADGVREQILLRLKDLMPAKGPDLLGAVRSYLEVLTKLQESKSAQVRLNAALLLVVPEKLSPAEANPLGGMLITALGKRLLVETEIRVFSAQVAALRRLAAKPVHIGGASARLRDAVHALKSKPETQQRIAALVTGLKQLALSDKTTPAEWLRTCETLLAPPLAQRQSVLSVLRYHLGRGNGAKVGTKEDQQNIAKLVLRTAALRPENQPWTADPEAKIVREAFTALRQAKLFRKDKALDTAPMRLMCLRCLAAVQDAALLVQVATEWLAGGDQVLQGVDRDAATLLKAEGLAQQKKFQDAWKLASPIGGTMLNERLRTTERIAQGMVTAKQNKEAAVLFADLVKRTPPAAKEHWSRLQQHLRVQFQLDPKQSQALLKQLDSWAKGRGKLTAEEQAAADKLRAELQGRAAPGK